MGFSKIKKLKIKRFNLFFTPTDPFYENKFLGNKKYEYGEKLFFVAFSFFAHIKTLSQKPFTFSFLFDISL